MDGNVEPPRREIREPRDAELAARDWMRWVGYADAELTQGGADGGVDVQATGAVAQVKAEATPVGRPAIQQLYGIAQVEGATPLFFAWGGYSDGAMTWADRAGVALFTLNMIGEVAPFNGAAEGIVSEVRSQDMVREQMTWRKRGQEFGRAAAESWLTDAKRRSVEEHRSLVLCHRDVYTTSNNERRNCWIQFFLPPESEDSRTYFTAVGLDFADIREGHQALGMDFKGGHSQGEDNIFFESMEGDTNVWSVLWSGHPLELVELVAAIADAAGRSLDDGYWRLDKEM